VKKKKKNIDVKTKQYKKYKIGHNNIANFSRLLLMKSRGCRFSGTTFLGFESCNDVAAYGSKTTRISSEIS